MVCLSSKSQARTDLWNVPGLWNLSIGSGHLQTLCGAEKILLISNTSFCGIKSWVKAYSLFFLSESKQQAGGMRSWRRKLKLSCRKEALREKIAKQTWKESHNNTSSLKYSTQTDHSWKVVFETTIYFCKITQLFWTQDSCQQ